MCTLCILNFSSHVDRWSSKFTWGGINLPQTDEFVIIQENHTVLLDTETSILKMLLIDGGTLIFDEKSSPHLRAENIMLTNNGKLIIGESEINPYRGKSARITMFGHLRSLELPIYGTKTLAVRNGTLKIHGKPKTPVWTNLRETVKAGSDLIKLREQVNWEVGDLVSIATTGYKNSQQENEEARISEILESGELTGAVLKLDRVLKFEHLSKFYPDSDFEISAEVGVLTRNIVFQGFNDPQWNDKIPACPDNFEPDEMATQNCFSGKFGEEVGSDQFGGCIMVHPKNDAEKDTAKLELTNLEVTYAGQAFRLGRYPIHFHFLKDSSSYVKDCSVHHVFNRAIVIHHTNRVRIENNVLFNVLGGSIFIEDGIEEFNLIKGNLVVFTRQSQALLNADITPAGIWITNPMNYIEDNVVAGGTHFGFWYRMHQHPDDQSFRRDYAGGCEKR